MGRRSILSQIRRRKAAQYGDAPNNKRKARWHGDAPNKKSKFARHGDASNKKKKAGQCPVTPLLP